MNNENRAAQIGIIIADKLGAENEIVNRAVSSAHRVDNAHVIDKSTGEVFGGEGTQTIFLGNRVIVGNVIPAEQTIIIPPENNSR